jgi:hypothetical protein
VRPMRIPYAIIVNDLLIMIISRPFVISELCGSFVVSLNYLSLAHCVSVFLARHVSGT